MNLLWRLPIIGKVNGSCRIDNAPYHISDDLQGWIINKLDWIQDSIVIDRNDKHERFAECPLHINHQSLEIMLAVTREGRNVTDYLRNVTLCIDKIEVRINANDFRIQKSKPGFTWPSCDLPFSPKDCYYFQMKRKIDFNRVRRCDMLMWFHPGESLDCYFFNLREDIFLVDQDGITGLLIPPS